MTGLEACNAIYENFNTKDRAFIIPIEQDEPHIQIGRDLTKMTRRVLSNLPGIVLVVVVVVVVVRKAKIEINLGKRKRNSVVVVVVGVVVVRESEIEIDLGK